jgi:GcrA cell cycle regulator
MNKRRFVTSVIWPDKHKQILFEMHEKGHTALEIAIKLNRTRNSVIGFIHRSGLSKSRPKKPVAPKTERKPQELKPATVHKLFPKPIVEIEKPKSTDGVLFVFTTNRNCKYIEGEPDGAHTRVCGKRAMSGKSWCFEHHALVYTKQPVLNFRGQLHHG